MGVKAVTRACIPLPLQVVIDDVGWWSGEDAHERGEPFRSGFVRNHVPADYEAIASLGRELRMRPQASMILCEWDTENILGELPGSQWMGADWDNSQWVGPHLEEAADIIRRNPQHFELGFHGVGHEFWTDGVMSRAELYSDEGCVRPREEVEARLEYYNRLLNQHDLGPFPESYVPCGHRYEFGLGPEGLVPPLKRAGIKYISNPFARMLNPVHGKVPEGKYFDVEEGIVTVDRSRDPFDWFVTDCRPEGDWDWPICGMHWPNLLHPDPERNAEVVARWVEFLRPIDERFERMLSPNTADCWAQLVFHRDARLTPQADGARLDFSGIKALGPIEIGDEFTVKVAGPAGLKCIVEGGTLVSAEWRKTAGHHVLRIRAGAELNPMRLTWVV